MIDHMDDSIVKYFYQRKKKTKAEAKPQTYRMTLKNSKSLKVLDPALIAKFRCT
jgi:hypothetical protein